MSDKKMQEIVLCGANAYEQKYYFNKEQFGKLPDEVQKELHIICVLFTEEVGGILTIGFDEEGELFLRTMADEYDFYYQMFNSDNEAFGNITKFKVIFKN